MKKIDKMRYFLFLLLKVYDLHVTSKGVWGIVDNDQDLDIIY